MNFDKIMDLVKVAKKSNLHSHSQYCDGHATIDELAAAACCAGMEVWGVSPHAPICLDSPCNMNREDVPAYLADMERLKEEYRGRMHLFTGMEIDYVSRSFGPSIPYFQELPLDYRIGSVHFVPDRNGEPHDCDGSVQRFAKYLIDYYQRDVRYVVERYFDQVMNMIDLGGFDLLGHFDKIAGNASGVDPHIEENDWYADLVKDVIDFAAEKRLVVEVNTKAYFERGRLYPAVRWIQMLKEREIPLVISTDCHWPDKTDIAYAEASALISR